MTHRIVIAAFVELSAFYDRSIAAGIDSILGKHEWQIEFYGRTDPWQEEAWKADVLFIREGMWPHPDRVKRPPIMICIGEDLTHLGVPSVLFDDAAVGVMAAQYLMSRGIQSFGCYGFPHHTWSLQRAAGFRETIEAAGFAYSGWGDKPWVGEPPPDTQIGGWLQSLPKPAGVLACCDRWGRALVGLSRGLIPVPEELAIVAVDNDELMCRLARPPLSSIQLASRHVGETAGELAVELIAGKTAPDHPILVPPEGVVTRQSTDVLAISDPDVAALELLIQKNFKDPINVEWLLRRVPGDRQRLSRDFRRIMGRPMLAELRRIRIEAAKQLLAGSRVSMSEIADRCGFPNTKRLAMAFRQETGSTATEYRERFRRHR
jgi:LacI family transcriptional regulator